ncbi:MAG: hypothetical protein IPP14_11545 [Planctomycetes bacterium]|nr:hypothetical protein [Planctomycetota bacterium]
MNDLPFAALILAITAILISSAGGFARLALAWHRNNCILQEGRERAAAMQNMFAAGIAAILPAISQTLSPHPHRCTGTIPMSDQDQAEYDQDQDQGEELPEVPYRPQTRPTGPRE